MSQREQIVITGASGKLGRDLATRLWDKGLALRLTDIVPFPLEIPDGSCFIQADLNDGVSLRSVLADCSAIVHLGGIVNYGDFDALMGPNLKSLHTVFEAAKQQRVRVIYASSNHVVGMYSRKKELSVDDPYRPDSFYGLFKSFGELIAQFYWDKYQVSSVSLRIGSCYETPKDRRMLRTWLSRRDFSELVLKSLTAATPGALKIWGVSDNQGKWWDEDHRKTIGWEPIESSEGWSLDAFPAEDPVEARFQGGMFAKQQYAGD
jgi:uronate dehydrogenase